MRARADPLLLFMRTPARTCARTGIEAETTGLQIANLKKLSKGKAVVIMVRGARRGQMCVRVCV